MDIDSTPKILAEGFREWLRLYERSIVWAVAASISFLLISRGQTNEKPISFPGIVGDISGSEAGIVAFVLFFILGGFALSAARRANVTLLQLDGMSMPIETLKALRSFPSLATHPNALFRVGIVLLPPLFLLASFILELRGEWKTGQWTEHPWGGFAMIWFLITALYGSIVRIVWRPLGMKGLQS